MKTQFRRFAGVIAVFTVFAVLALGSGSSSEGKPITDSSPDNGADEITIDETVLFDRDNIIVTAKSYDTDSIWGEGIKLLIENNSAQDITVGCDALIVNNYMISNLFSCSVAAGKKANDTLYLSTSELKAAGIDKVGQVEMYFYVYESDSWDKMFTTDVITLHTSAYDNMDVTPNDAGKELYNNGGIRIVGKYVDEESFWGAAVLLYMENNSGKNVIIQCDDLSVNGFMITPYFSCTVYDGKMAIDDITLMSSQLEENGITSVDDIELCFQIIDADNWNTISESENISFSTK